jgi:fructosamine-3-kinase
MARLSSTVADLLGASVASLTPVRGGDINIAYEVVLDDGRRVFVKANASGPPDLFVREAEGLAWLAGATSLRLPRVLATSVDPPLLCLEWIASAPRAADHGERLGRGLAELHAHHEDAAGLERQNYIATISQDNTPTESWPRFYAERRILPIVRSLRDLGRFTLGQAAVFDALTARFDDLLATGEPCGRLHGDLWGGNTMTDERGTPCLIDPAVYAGNREVDLAMMQLFGGFERDVFAAYEEVLPLPPGASERVALYQLWPVLVHAQLFGGSYVDRAVRTARKHVDR